MKPSLLAIIAGVFGALAGFSAMNSDIPLMLLGLIGVVGTMVWYGLAGAKERRVSDLLDGLSPESRALLRPIRRLQGELAASIASGGETARIIGGEALEESGHILKRCVAMVQIREDLAKALAGRGQAAAEVRELQDRLSTAQSDQERASLDSALRARQKEQGHYQELAGRIAEIDGAVRQAEAALSEIKARLAIASTSPHQAGDKDAELAESLLKLRALSVSFDEAEDLLQEQR